MMLERCEADGGVGEGGKRRAAGGGPAVAAVVDSLGPLQKRGCCLFLLAPS